MIFFYQFWDIIFGDRTFPFVNIFVIEIVTRRPSLLAWRWWRCSFSRPPFSTVGSGWSEPPTKFFQNPLPQESNRHWWKLSSLLWAPFVSSLSAPSYTKFTFSPRPLIGIGACSTTLCAWPKGKVPHHRPPIARSAAGLPCWGSNFRYERHWLKILLSYSNLFQFP